MKTERTEAQKLAARLNGAKSRGPVTPEGKAVSSQNALRHGLTARRVVLGNELEEAWDDFVQALTEEWNPQTATELQLIHDLAAARWRLNRLLDIETESLEIEMSRQEEHYEQVVLKGTELTRITFAWQSLQKEGTLPAIHRHETRLRRILRESLSQLLAIQAQRHAAEAAAAQGAASARDEIQRAEPAHTDSVRATPDIPAEQSEPGSQPAATCEANRRAPDTAQNEPGNHRDPAPPPRPPELLAA